MNLVPDGKISYNKIMILLKNEICLLQIPQELSARNFVQQKLVTLNRYAVLQAGEYSGEYLCVLTT